MNYRKRTVVRRAARHWVRLSKNAHCPQRRVCDAQILWILIVGPDPYALRQPPSPQCRPNRRGKTSHRGEVPLRRQDLGKMAVARTRWVRLLHISCIRDFGHIHMSTSFATSRIAGYRPLSSWHWSSLSLHRRPQVPDGCTPKTTARPLLGFPQHTSTYAPPHDGPKHKSQPHGNAGSPRVDADASPMSAPPSPSSAADDETLSGARRESANLMASRLCSVDPWLASPW